VYLLVEFEELEKTLGNFIIRAIVYRTICAIKLFLDKPTKLEKIATLCLDILEQIVSKVSQFNSVCEELTKCLPFLVLSLTSFSLNPNVGEYFSQRAVGLLEILICTHTDDMNLYDYINAVTNLDYFPADEHMFSPLNDHLKILKQSQQVDEIENVSFLLCYILFLIFFFRFCFLINF